MPLVDLAVKKWRRWRADVIRGEESRKKVHRQLQKQNRHDDCQKLAYFLWEADGKPEGSGDRYYLEAQKRLSGIGWRLYKLHQPFISLEKKVIEPLDGWADRANIFQFFSKISPIIEAFGVLAIPFVILAFEVRQEKRQQEFEERLISTQADVRQQQAVREYLSQVTAIHLESDEGEKLRKDEELQKLLEANTLALFNELSVREDVRQDSGGNEELDWEKVMEIRQRDRKGQVVEFLSGLNWINRLDSKEPLVSLDKADLSGANLLRVDLSGANLSGANLSGAYLFGADFSGADLSKADLLGADLSEADLLGANLSKANLSGADLFKADFSKANLLGANFSGAYFSGADLSGADLLAANLTDTKYHEYYQINTACNWEQAVYTDPELGLVYIDPEFGVEEGLWRTRDEEANQQIIEEIRQDKASNPPQPPDCEIFDRYR